MDRSIRPADRYGDVGALDAGYVRTYAVVLSVNLTLSVDEDVLDRARRVAQHQGTSLNALVRDYLAQLAGKKSGPDLAREMRETFKKPAGKFGDWKWNRDEIYEERLGRCRERSGFSR